MIEEKRNILLDELSNVEVKEPIKLSYDSNTLKELFFDKKVNSEEKEYYVLAKEMTPILSKIDFSNISFDNVCITGVDFSKMRNVKINPQKIHRKDMCYCKLKGVEFIGSEGLNLVDLFNGVAIYKADFTGSKGAIINPQTIVNKNLEHTKFNSVEFKDITQKVPQDELFDDVKIYETDFTGSKGAKINPLRIHAYELGNSKFSGVEFIGPFYKATINGCDFTGSKGAIIDPSFLGWTNNIIYDINFRDAQIIGEFDNIYFAFNIKTKGAIMTLPQKGSLVQKRINYLTMKH